MKKQIFLILCFSLLLMGAPMVSGCSSQSETTTTQQTTASTDPEASPATTTTTTTTTSDEPDSVLGATFHAIGTIVLFPFRLLGDAIELIV